MTKEELHGYALKFKERLWRAEAAEYGENSPQAESVKEMSIETIKASLLLRTCLKKKKPTQKLMFMLNHWSSKILT